MRAVLVLVAACGAYDPIAEVPHGSREMRDTETAIATILAENPTPRVYAIGEYHQTRSAIAKTSPLARFTQEIIALLEPHAHHLVVETWLDASCQATSKLQNALDQLTQRPGTTQMELLRLARRAQQMHLEAHGLPMTCIEHSAVLDPRHGIDMLLVLEVITEKLKETTEALLAADPDHSVIVYGGALHNDLYPHWPLDQLSYAKPLAQELGGGVLEIDLVVPEVVADMHVIRDEPWFPLLGRASPERVIVWERGPSSYVVILPAQSEAVAKVALPLDVM